MMPSRLAKQLAPEDIQAGMYVVRLRVTHECLGFWFDDFDKTAIRRITLTPDEHQYPLKVLEIALPFVLVKSAKGQTGMLDLRLVTLAEVGERFGREAFLHRRDKPEKEAQAETSKETSAKSK
jgi:hypothetical protein